MSFSELLARRLAVIGMNRRNVQLVYEENPRRLYPLADDKLLAKRLLSEAGVPVPENLAVCEGLFELTPFMQRIESLEQFVLKPARGGGGNGIQVVGERTAPGRWVSAGGSAITRDDLRTLTADIVFGAFARGALEDVAFVEPRVRPSREYAELWADGLCDVRVITHRARPVMAMVRVPTARSKGKANLHQGGLGLGVDLESGRVERAQLAGQPLQAHPDSGVRLLGRVMPQWAETVEVAVRAAKAVPLGYLGVDIVVDIDRGPLVLEINARPGLEIQNVNGLGLGAALERA